MEVTHRRRGARIQPMIKTVRWLRVRDEAQPENALASEAADGGNLKLNMADCVPVKTV